MASTGGGGRIMMVTRIHGHDTRAAACDSDRGSYWLGLRRVTRAAASESGRGQ